MSRGPGKAFERVFDENVDRVYSYFTYRLVPASEAERLAELVFERALERWPTFDARRASVACWLLEIARTSSAGDSPGSHERASQPPHPDRDRTLAAEGGMATSAASQWSPELEAALACLDTRDRELVALRLGGRLTTDEIGRLIGVDQAVVLRELSPALRRVGEQLSPAGGQPGASGPVPATPSAAIASRTNPETA